MDINTICFAIVTKTVKMNIEKWFSRYSLRFNKFYFCFVVIMIFNFIDPANGTSLYQNFGNDSHPVDFKECDDIVEKALAYDQISHYFKEADGKFLLFIKETCPYCQKAMSELTDKQIDYSKT